MGTDSSHAPPPRQTPELDRLLGGLRRRLGRLVLMHGTGTVLAVLSGWLAWAFVADWGLRVPLAIRVGHGLVLVGLTAAFAWRALVKPLRRIPGRTGLATLFERAHPELHEVLSSATQFGALDASPIHGDPVLRARVMARAEERAGQLSARAILESRPIQQRFLVGLGAAALLLAGGLWQPGHARIFFNRLLGGDLSWPRRTTLSIQIPGFVEEAVAEGPIRLRVARGTDVPIVVHAEGVVPREVQLHFEGGRDLDLKRSGARTFRTMLSSCQEDVAFHATGGDDHEGRQRVEVTVLQPPDVAAVAIAIEPPAYTGLPRRVEHNTDVEVVAGSRLSVHVATLPPDATGRARILPADRTVPMEPAPFPADPQAADDVAANPATGLSFELSAERSGGFQLLLEDASGLSNPDPGLWQVKVLPDRSPEVLVLSPTRSDFEVVPGGLVPLRARISDDFGIASAGWSVRPALGTEEAPVVHEGVFELRVPGADGRATEPAGGAHALAVGSAGLEVDSFGTPETPVAVDQRFVIELVARDRQEPEPNETRTLPIRARVVAPEELLRRMQERLAQAGRDARSLSELQEEKRRRVEELIEAFDSDEAQPASESASLAAALAGQRRVLGDAQALGRSLAAIAEEILYARLDDRAEPLLADHAARMSTFTDVDFQSAPWRALAAGARDGRLGSAGFAQNLVLLVDLALEIADDHVEDAGLALDRAERSVDAKERVAALVLASELQTSSLERMQVLLEKLAEWDNFQNVLALTRDILNRQKNLLERTQQFATQSER